MNILITGGHGLLGNKLGKIYPDALRPTHGEMNVLEDLFDSVFIRSIDPNEIDVVIHAAAEKSDVCKKYPLFGMRTNIVGTANVVEFCSCIGAKLVYISTDYVFRGDRGDYKVEDEVRPVGYYAETKLAGEYVVKCLPNYLIVRLSFLPDIFPFDKAFANQYSTRLPVSEAAERVADLVDQKAVGIHHVAGVKRSVYDYAVATSGGKEIERAYLEDDSRPRNVSLI